MDRRCCLQRERSERPANRRLPGAASRRRDQSAKRTGSFHSNEENREDRSWPATLYLNCLGLAAETPADQEPRCQPPSAAHRYIVVSNVAGGITEVDFTHVAWV